jgi:hypothetical protein
MDVKRPRFGEIATAGVRFDLDVIVGRGRVRRRKKGPSKAYRDQFGHTPPSADGEIPSSTPGLVTRTGAAGRLPMMTEVPTRPSLGVVEVVELPTAKGCRLLRSVQPKEVNAILHGPC